MKLKDACSLEKKAMTSIDSILKSRDITLPAKVHLVKVMIFPVVMYGCESWTIKKTECWRIVAFEPWCWRRLLRVPWTARRSNQSILKETSPEYSLVGLMLKLKLQYLATWCEELTDLKRPWCWEKLKVGEGDNRGWDGWMTSPTQWTWFWISSRVGDGQGSLACCTPWGREELDMTKHLNWTYWVIWNLGFIYLILAAWNDQVEPLRVDTEKRKNKGK